MRRSAFLVSSLFLIACGGIGQQPGPAPPAGSATQPVLVFSDLHFNPFYDPSLTDSLARADVTRWGAIFESSRIQTRSQYGSDTNYPLLQSALAAMRRAAPGTGLVLIAGDFLAHGFQSSFKRAARDTSAAALEDFTAKTLQFVAAQLTASFPDAQILPALGNNDSSCGDYMTEPGSAFLQAFANAWQPAVNRRNTAADFLTVFPAAGHYTALAPSVHARVIVLNDVYLSARYTNACGSADAQPGRDALAWLKGVLEASRARGEQVWLLSHIPPGLDVYATLRSPDSVVNMLQPSLNAGLLETLREFAPIIRYSVYGHTHMTEFRLVEDSTAGTMVGNQGIPAISPIFGNNPAFFVFAVAAGSGRISDYTVYALGSVPAAGAGDSATWSQEYALRTAFGQDGLAAEDLAALQQSLRQDSAVRAKYVRFYDSGSGRAAPAAATWSAYWCGINNLVAEYFTRCYAGSAR